MSLKNMLGFGKKSNDKEKTEVIDDSVSLSYDTEKQNTFDSVSEASDGYNKPMAKILEENNSNSLSSENINDLKVNVDGKNDKENFYLNKSIDIPTVKEEKSKKEKKHLSALSFFGVKKKVKIENEFTKLEEDEEISNKLSNRKDKTESKTNGSSSSNLSESSFESKQKKLPLLGNFNTSRQYQIMTLVALISTIVVGFGAFEYFKNAKLQSTGQRQSIQLKSDLQKFENSFSSTTIGKVGSYDNMLEHYDTIMEEYKLVRKSDDYFPQSDTLSGLQNKLDNNIRDIEKNVDKVKAQSDLLKNSTERVTSISSESKNLSSQIDRLTMIYLQIGGTQNELTNIYLMSGLLQSITNNASSLLLSSETDTNTATNTALNMNADRVAFKKYLSELYYGDEGRGIAPISFGTPFNTYSKLANRWVHFADTIDVLNKRSPELLSVRQLSSSTTAIVAAMDSILDEHSSFYVNSEFRGITIAKNIMISGMILILLSLILIFYIYSFEKDNRALLEKIDNNKNQTSILRLLNEMVPLQDGDLTAHATVTDEITGAIADSINATVGSLGSLVKKIKDTSFLMKEKTSEVNIISLNMLKENDEQTTSIKGAAISVKDIANAIRDISEKTKKSAVAAEESKRASEEGSKQVFDSVKSMQSIDGTMNETDRLMSKVQDSSKQISEIVELLSDITEETSILALNATVQAAKAGDAGKGFKIVADSIQELADSASDATRRVGALIAAVQTDIQAVSDSVDKTKTEVKNGVSLSESAGISLRKITEVSNRLSGIVREISQEAIVYAKNSDEISKNMENILVSTEVTKKSTEKTASSITEIADISNELGDSVQSFKVE